MVSQSSNMQDATQNSDLFSYYPGWPHPPGLLCAYPQHFEVKCLQMTGQSHPLPQSIAVTRALRILRCPLKSAWQGFTATPSNKTAAFTHHDTGPVPSLGWSLEWISSSWKLRGFWSLPAFSLPISIPVLTTHFKIWRAPSAPKSAWDTKTMQYQPHPWQSTEFREQLRLNESLNALGYPQKERLHLWGNWRTLCGKSAIGIWLWEKASGSPPNPSESTYEDSGTIRFYNMSHPTTGMESPSQNLRKRDYFPNLSKNFRSLLSNPFSSLLQIIGSTLLLLKHPFTVSILFCSIHTLQYPQHLDACHLLSYSSSNGRKSCPSAEGLRGLEEVLCHWLCFQGLAFQ